VEAAAPHAKTQVHAPLTTQYSLCIYGVSYGEGERSHQTISTMADLAIASGARGVVELLTLSADELNELMVRAAAHPSLVYATQYYILYTMCILQGGCLRA